jgi:hypothetical protein
MGRFPHWLFRADAIVGFKGARDAIQHDGRTQDSTGHESPTMAGVVDKGAVSTDILNFFARVVVTCPDRLTAAAAVSSGAVERQ